VALFLLSVQARNPALRRPVESRSCLNIPLPFCLGAFGSNELLAGVSSAYRFSCRSLAIDMEGVGWHALPFKTL